MSQYSSPDHGPQQPANRPHRPLPLPAPGLWLPAPDADPVAKRERAYATASALLAAGRDDPGLAAELVRLDETLGLDALRELWAEPEEDGLPAALWSLYLLRAWLTRQSAEAARIYRSGRGHAPVADAVSGVPETPTAEDLAAVGDAVVTTALRGDPPAAMERAAAVHRVVACGRFAVSEVGDDEEARKHEARLAEGNLRAAARLETAAAAWRAGAHPGAATGPEDADGAGAPRP
ncbi:hypothetical protein [Motilibacter aurantiacus]|uniref:hypothetical protein n=1 Tax=Motilibacter aurantiacus TaxID=2714955 RepID=UPI00140DA8AF|nr:hypothetical protein [Motilibacter aurantiacus]NHC46776.1 hypothetical protein [Motilibacter aurantiacus]